MTGPMTIAALALAAAVVTRVLGLDHAGVAFCFFKSSTGYACSVSYTHLTLPTNREV